jgi:hypothetical protein
VFLSLLLCSSLPAGATAYSDILSMDALLSKGDTVVRGEVLNTSAGLAPDGLIWTTVTLEVDEALDQSNERLVEFRIPGGTVDDLTLSIPGGPRFQEGQDVLVFLDDDRLLGFGQGAFLVEDDIAFRGLGNAIEAQPVRMPVKRLLGDVRAVTECLRDQVIEDYARGWSLRSSSVTRMGSGAERAFAVNMYGGVEYNLRVCGDNQAGPLDIVVYDDAGREVAWQTGEPRAVAVQFIPEFSGRYYVAIQNESLALDAFRAGVGLAISYR